MKTDLEPLNYKSTDDSLFIEGFSCSVIRWLIADLELYPSIYYCDGHGDWEVYTYKVRDRVEMLKRFWLLSFTCHIKIILVLHSL